MPRFPLPLLSALLAAGLLAACASPNEDKTAGWSTDKIYSEARDELNAGAYDKAVPLLEKLEGRAAGTQGAIAYLGHLQIGIDLLLDALEQAPLLQ